MSPALVLYPPDVAYPRWVAEDHLRRRRFSLRTLAATILLRALGLASESDFVREIASLGGVDSAQVARTVVALKEAGLLLEAGHVEQDSALRWHRRLRAQWTDAGWAEAAHYHLLTFDYPGIDYSSKDGWDQDLERMRGYGLLEADDNRVKRIDGAELRIPLPSPSDELLSGSLKDALLPGAISNTSFGASQLHTILSMAFGKTRDVPYTKRLAAPKLRRTSPSGGGRHPTEGYVLVRQVAGHPSGLFHVCSDPCELERVRIPNLTSRELDGAFPNSCGVWQPSAVVLFTSVFDRNMYRYREPRTFRTVHMDVGHLAGTVELVASAMGFTTKRSTDNAEAIEQLLGLNALEEAYFVSVSIGTNGAIRCK